MSFSTIQLSPEHIATHTPKLLQFFREFGVQRMVQEQLHLFEVMFNKTWIIYSNLS